MLRSIKIFLSVSLALIAWGVHGFSGTPPVPVTSAVAGLVSTTGAAESLAPLLSSDARFVVFSSLAGDLVTNDFNNAMDAFVYDRQAGRLSLVNTNSEGITSANGRSIAVDISTNGRWILFESAASDLVMNDINNVPDLFLHDQLSGENTIVSLDRYGAPVGGFRNPALTPDGHFFLFESWLSTLATNACFGTQLFLRDLQTSENILVSVSTNVAMSGRGASYNGVMTPDGRWVAFQSRASDLTPNDNNLSLDIYVRDVRAGTTLLVSVDPSGTSSTNTTSAATNPTISGDGRYVAFESTATNLAAGVAPGIHSAVYLRDLAVGATTFISAQSDDGSASWPVLSGDGRFVAYESSTNIYCWDGMVGGSFLLSTNCFDSRGGNAPSHSPQFTPDGRYCVFLSSATNLVPNGTGSIQCRVYRRDMSTGEILLVGGDAGASTANGGWASLSDDGNFVAFQSSGSVLSSNDYNGSFDVFVRDIAADTTSLVSAHNPLVKATAASAASAVGPNCLSSNGRYLLFSSFARNLLPHETSGLQDFYVRDLWTGSNQLVTASWDGGECRNGEHYAASLSGNGRWVVFQSSATNLVQGDTNNCSDIFVRDLWNRTNLLGSVPKAGVGFGNNDSVSPAISDDGRFITFQSLAWNLVSVDFPNTFDAFLRDMTQQTNLTLSMWYKSPMPYGAQTNFGNGAYNPFTPQITPDGQWAVIWSRYNLSTNSMTVLAPPYCFACDGQGQMIPIWLATNGMFSAANWLKIAPGGRFAVFGASGFMRNTMIGVYDFMAMTNCQAVNGTGTNASLSADGRWLAFEGKASNFGTNSANSLSDVFLLDRANNSVRLASFSEATEIGGNGPSFNPILSGDGRYLVFKSQATDLVMGDTNGVSDLFVRDLKTGELVSLSADSNGIIGNRVSGNAILGTDGRTLVFESFASNLAPGDLNESKDVFILRLPADSLAEFRILTLTSVATGSTTLFWNSVPGRAYRVEFSESLSSPTWTELPGDIVATNYTSAKADEFTGPGIRFYRVRLVD